MKKANIDLQVHPFLGMNSLTDVVEAMDYTKLDVVALESLNSNLYPRILKDVERFYPKSRNDSAGVKLLNGKYLLNAKEYNTKENLHVLTVGYSSNTATLKTEIRRVIDEGLKNDAFVLLDHPLIDNKKTKTAGHISKDLEEDLEKLCREYSGQIAVEWNGYCIPWMRRVLKSGLNLAGFNIQYHDVNKKAEELSERLKAGGYNVPVVADTDLHARKKRHLKYMGTSRIIIDVEGESGKDIVKSMKKNIFEGRYENVKRYVSSSHLLEAFCFPIIMGNYFYKPRA